MLSLTENDANNSALFFEEDQTLAAQSSKDQTLPGAAREIEVEFDETTCPEPMHEKIGVRVCPAAAERLRWGRQHAERELRQTDRQT